MLLNILPYTKETQKRQRALLFHLLHAHVFSFNNRIRIRTGEAKTGEGAHTSSKPQEAPNMFSNQLPPPSASVHSTPDIPRPLTTSTTTKATAGALFLLLPPACSCQLSCSSSCIVTRHSFNNRIRIRFDSRTWEAKTGEGQEKAHERAPQEAPNMFLNQLPPPSVHFTSIPRPLPLQLTW